MGDEHLTQAAKARLFDQLAQHEDLLVEALMRLAADKARALITIHKSGLRPGGRAFTQQDFGLDKVAAVVEILTGDPLDVNDLVRQERERLEGDLTNVSTCADPSVGAS
ncbi:hypothetical protein [Rubrivivax gelatinosus]|uniref:hypothetical protein n=1 Tax=Rubrivivax gelatinosus TaxID=28068 RepID=UPI0005C189E4|nr:hypothetical protein [Rubrivivax gelatinosus]MBG6083095.1 hypothetical protein [Rubrivivax gelatinosus]